MNYNNKLMDLQLPSLAYNGVYVMVLLLSIDSESYLLPMIG